MRRRGAGSIAGSPVLIGAATTLVVLVAVFLAYNANNGLPFVRTYDLRVDVPNAANLTKNAEVRVGGVRVGTVAQIVPEGGPDGRYHAQLRMKLDTALEPLPKDSTFLVRPRSALGLKYVQITKGASDHGFPDGATVPLANARPQPVELDQFLNMFDDPTRHAIRQNLTTFGNALAGRGQDLNTAIGEFGPLLTDLVPVMSNLSDRRTRLGQLFGSLGRAAATVAPAAQAQADLFAGLDTTFAALAGVTSDIQASLEGGPAALDAATRGFPRQRPFLAHSTRLFAELRPGVRSLRTAAPDLAAALTAGERSLRGAVALNRRLTPTFQALQRFAADPLATLGLRDLRATSDVLTPPVAYLTPAQTVCNYMTLFFRNASSLLSDGDANGTWQRFIIIAAPQGPNSEGGPSSAPANGPAQDNHLHTDPYPNTASPGQPRECEAGNEGYLAGRTVAGHDPGRQPAGTEKTTRKLSR